jgi:AraC-like DNA-binding protein
MVRMMVAGGIIYDDIAAAIGISRSTLKTRYKTELDTDPREEMRKRRH